MIVLSSRNIEIPFSDCSVNNGDCDQVCYGFASDKVPHCGCKDHYQLDRDGRTCHYADKCREDNGGCQHLCRQEPGSYTTECDCYSGYDLTGDGKSCVDIDECRVGNGGCSHGCINLLGNHACLCDSGSPSLFHSFRALRNKFV